MFWKNSEKFLSFAENDVVCYFQPQFLNSTLKNCEKIHCNSQHYTESRYQIGFTLRLLFPEIYTAKVNDLFCTKTSLKTGLANCFT